MLFKNILFAFVVSLVILFLTDLVFLRECYIREIPANITECDDQSCGLIDYSNTENIKVKKLSKFKSFLYGYSQWWILIEKLKIFIIYFVCSFVGFTIYNRLYINKRAL